MFGCCVLKYFEFVLQYKIKLNFMKRFLILFSIVFALQMCALAQKYTVGKYGFEKIQENKILQEIT